MIHKLARLFYPYGAIRRVWRGPLRGTKFQVAPGYGVTYAFGWEELHLRALDSFIKPGVTVFDIGANRGHISLLFAKAVGNEGKVLAFEPIDDFRDIFDNHMTANRIENTELVNGVLTNESGEVTFEFSNEHSTEGHIQGIGERPEDSESTLRKVMALTIDDFVSERNTTPDFLKVDVEGAARLVLEGAALTLEKDGPDVFIELHGPEEQQAVQDLLISNGYVARNLEGQVVTDATVGWNSPLICRREKQ